MYKYSGVQRWSEKHVVYRKSNDVARDSEWDREVVS